MKQIFQSSALFAYKLAKSSGFLSTNIGHKISTNAYFLYKKLYEPKLDNLLAMVPKNSTIIDVGANVGFLTLKFSRWVSNNGRVIAIEPEPLNIKTLTQILKDKRIVNVDVINGAAAEKEGTLFLNIHPLNPADHRISENGFPIKAFTIDGLLEASGRLPVSLIKIDVQGAELRVLEGAKKTIAKYRPIILIEIHDEALISAGYSAQSLIDILTSNSYELWDDQLNQSRPFSSKDHILREKVGYADYIFIHASR